MYQVSTSKLQNRGPLVSLATLHCSDRKTAWGHQRGLRRTSEKVESLAADGVSCCAADAMSAQQPSP